ERGSKKNNRADEDEEEHQTGTLGDHIVLKSLKQKDEEEFEDIHLRLVRVELDDGRTSMVVDLATPQPKRLSPKAETALLALATFGEKGTTPTVWEQKADLGSNTTFRRV